MTTELDVIVVGAGLSGLCAAYQLKCADNLRVLVLEAKDRIGGRTLSVKLKAANDDTDVWDLGGQWVARTQPHILSLLEQLGLETFKQHVDGTKLLQVDGNKVRTYQNKIPKIPFLANWEMMRFISKIENLCQHVPASNPYACPRAAEFDGMTCETFKNQNLRWQASRELMEIAFRATFGVEPSRCNLLAFLALCNSTGGHFEGLLNFSESFTQEFRVKGGTYQICTILAQKLGKDAVLLNTAVTDIFQDDEKDVVTVYTSNGDCFRASRVVMAAPLTEAVKINYKPCLPEPRRVLLQNMPVGHLTKFIITYERAFWRERKFSGEIVSNGGMKLTAECDSGPIGVVYDATSASGNPALVGFIAGHQGIQWSVKVPSERKAAVLQSLSSFFGNDALYPLDYVEKNWSNEPYNGGCPVNIVPPGLMQYVSRHLRTPHGRIHWAGTETATVWCGYLNGAVQAGWRAAKEVLHDLRPDYFFDKDIETGPSYEIQTASKHEEVHDFLHIPKFFHITFGLTLLGLCIFGIRRKYFRMAI